MVEKIVITGGPCAGKSTAMSRLQEELSQLGWKVLIIAESATELITSGLTPFEYPEFQTYLTKYQLEKEHIYEKAAESLGQKTLIVCDRGVIDNKAYMTQEHFDRVLKDLGTNEVELRDNYGAVFHLVTAAKGAEKFYTTANNQARYETAEEAVIADDKIIDAWTGHPHFRIIDNSTGFDEKIKRLLTEITSYLGEPEPYEIERKFLIEYPNLEWLESLPNVQKVEIIQTYLNSDNDDEVRVRQRGLDGNFIYTQTIKRKVTAIKRMEIEKRLSKDEYLSLLMNADTSRRQIRKTRYCMTYKNCYLELDIYPFWQDKAILEIELSSELTPVEIPPEIAVIKEVTNDLSYRNINLASL